MSVLQKLSEHLKQKGLRATVKKVWKHYVFFHEELLWMERDLVSPVPPHKLGLIHRCKWKPSPRKTPCAFTRYFGDRVGTMAELANEGHTGHMHLDDKGDAVAFIWGSARDYHDRHYYGCRFPVKAGEFFEFGGELTRAYWGTDAVGGSAAGPVESHGGARLQQSGGCLRIPQHPGAQAAHAHGLQRARADHERLQPVRSLALLPRNPLQRFAPGCPAQTHPSTCYSIGDLSLWRHDSNGALRCAPLTSRQRLMKRCACG